MKKTRFSVNTENLEFDRHNPRLVQLDGLSQASDEEVICALVREADIGELLESIVANTYLDIEPLIVTESEIEVEGNFRVLEGNRRLCAIRLIQNPDIAKNCRISLPKNISDAVRESIKEVQVYLSTEQNQARAFIGFKHINGAHRWNSYAKARFLTEWYLDELEDDITIESIARQLGDENQTVRSLIGGMLVLQQAEDRSLFQITDRTKIGPFGFSHLYTALGRNEYKDFLGLEKNWNIHPKPHPISVDKEQNLQEILQYIYGSRLENIESVIASQNPNLKQLGHVLSMPIALEILRSTKSLESAYDEVMHAKDVFCDRLIIANAKVKDTLANVSKFSRDDCDTLLSIAETMNENSSSVLELMKIKCKKKKEQ